uniref:Asp/Glu/hydantoin racemase n=1 Tax=Heterorhabditis bacteriophora TaxID=37862 RepID=A0A1I7WPW4_HETBA
MKNTKILIISTCPNVNIKGKAKIADINVVNEIV